MVEFGEAAVGTKVIFVGPSTSAYDDYGLTLGDVGVVDYVDNDDVCMTYRVKFPQVDWGVWVGNDRLVAASDFSADDEPCGWKTRALKAETELKELKKALATLAED